MVEKVARDQKIVTAFHSRKEVVEDPEFEIKLSQSLKDQYNQEALIELYARFADGEGYVDTLMRRAVWRAAAHSFGSGIHIGSRTGFKHIETFEIGDGVFIGSQSYIQGRIGGKCTIGRKTWIGPQSYFDARDLVIGDHVGWGPGAKVLGSAHVGLPIDVPIIQTDLEIKRVTIEPWVDVGVNAVILPGVTIGKGSQVGAGAVVTADVPPFSVVAGIPAKLIKWRKGDEGKPNGTEE